MVLKDEPNKKYITVSFKIEIQYPAGRKPTNFPVR